MRIFWFHDGLAFGKGLAVFLWAYLDQMSNLNKDQFLQNILSVTNEYVMSYLALNFSLIFYGGK